MDDHDPAEAAASLESDAAAPASREQVTDAMSGPPPTAPPPAQHTSQPPAEASPASAPAQAESSDAKSPAAASPSITTAPAAPPRLPAIRVPQFVAPSSYLRFNKSHGSTMTTTPEKPAPKPRQSRQSPLDKEQLQGLVRCYVPTIHSSVSPSLYALLRRPGAARPAPYCSVRALAYVVPELIVSHRRRSANSSKFAPVTTSCHSHLGSSC